MRTGGGAGAARPASGPPALSSRELRQEIRLTSRASPSRCPHSAGRAGAAVRAGRLKTGRWALTEQSAPQPRRHPPFSSRIPCSVCRITSTQAKHPETTQVPPLPSEVQSCQLQRLRLGLLWPRTHRRTPRVTQDPRCLQGSPLEPTSPQGQGDTPQRDWTALVPQEHLLPAWHPPPALRPSCTLCARSVPRPRPPSGLPLSQPLAAPEPSSRRWTQAPPVRKLARSPAASRRGAAPLAHLRLLWARPGPHPPAPLAPAGARPPA